LLNAIWLGMVLASIGVAAFTGRMDALQKATFDGAKSAVYLVIDLTGSMVFFLGLMRVARDGGLLLAVSRGLAPLMRRLFPDVPANHPAMGAMIMNIASNVLGLGEESWIAHRVVERLAQRRLPIFGQAWRRHERPGRDLAREKQIEYLAIAIVGYKIHDPWHVREFWLLA